MSQLSLSLDTPLMVRDGRGRYRPADADQILEAARQVIEQKMQRGETFTSPEAVKCWRRFKIEPPCRLNFEPGCCRRLKTDPLRGHVPLQN